MTEWAAWCIKSNNITVRLCLRSHIFYSQFANTWVASCWSLKRMHALALFFSHLKFTCSFYRKVSHTIRLHRGVCLNRWRLNQYTHPGTWCTVQNCIAFTSKTNLQILSCRVWYTLRCFNNSESLINRNRWSIINIHSYSALFLDVFILMSDSSSVVFSGLVELYVFC